MCVRYRRNLKKCTHIHIIITYDLRIYERRSKRYRKEQYIIITLTVLFYYYFLNAL